MIFSSLMIPAIVEQATAWVHKTTLQPSSRVQVFSLGVPKFFCQTANTCSTTWVVSRTFHQVFFAFVDEKVATVDSPSSCSSYVYHILNTICSKEKQQERNSQTQIFQKNDFEKFKKKTHPSQSNLPFELRIKSVVFLFILTCDYHANEYLTSYLTKINMTSTIQLKGPTFSAASLVSRFKCTFTKPILPCSLELGH